MYGKSQKQALVFFFVHTGYFSDICLTIFEKM